MQTWIADYFWWVIAVECLLLTPLLVLVFTVINRKTDGTIVAGGFGGLASGLVLMLATAWFSGKASLLDGLLITAASVGGAIIGMLVVITIITKIMWR